VTAPDGPTRRAMSALSPLFVRADEAIEIVERVMAGVAMGSIIPQLTLSFLSQLPLAARAQTSRRGMPSGHSEKQPATLGNVHKAR
jgi:hypothetical protein